MSKLREAAQALIDYDDAGPDDGKGGWLHWDAKFDALRAALAEFDAETTKEGQTQTDSKQEPVANHSEDDLDMVKCRQIAREYAWPNSNIDSGNLYWALHVALRHAAPPQRQPLTQDEAWDIWDALADRGKKGEDIVHAFARAIERRHGITGETK